MPGRSTRADDEALLQMIRLRTEGISGPAIAQQFGMTQTTVRTKTNRVLEADLAESGEWGKAVQSRYWRFE